MLTLRVPPFRRAALLVLPLLLAVVILTSLSPVAMAQPAQSSGESTVCMTSLVPARRASSFAAARSGGDSDELAHGGIGSTGTGWRRSTAPYAGFDAGDVSRRH